MKPHSLFLAALAFVPNLHAEVVEGGYARFSVGGNWANNYDILSRGANFSHEFDPGYRFSIAPGVRLNKYTAFEADIGLLWNDLSRVTTPAGAIDLEGQFWRVPLMLNAVLHYPVASLRPYAGFGIGALYQDFDATGPGYRYSQGRWDYAVQFFLGLNYQINDVLSIGATYNYLHAIPRENDWIVFGTPDEPQPYGNHSIMLVIQFDF